MELQIVRTRHPPTAYLGPLSELLHEEVPGLSVGDLQRRLERLPESDRLFLALDSELLIGYAQFRLSHDLLEEDTVELRSIIVAPERRRQGIGTRLMTAAETWALQSGRARLRLRAEVTRSDALAFFAALGYEQSATEQAYTRDLDLARRSEAPTQPA